VEETGPVERLTLGCDQRFQRDAVGDYQGAAVLLDQALLFEAREKAADGFAGRADHLSDLFVSHCQLHLAGVSGFGVLVEPSYEQPSELFAGGIGKDEVADFAAGASVVLTDVLGHPQGNFAIQAHEPQQIALPEEADLAGFLGLGCGFILASGNDCGNSERATGLDNPQNQGATVAATDGKLYLPPADDEHSSGGLTFGEQNCSGRVGGGDGFLL